MPGDEIHVRLDPELRVTPIDVGHVCLNLDRAAFEDGGLPWPETLRDLADPALAGQLVVQNPATSSPGLAFLLATVAEFGEDGRGPRPSTSLGLLELGHGDDVAQAEHEPGPARCRGESAQQGGQLPGHAEGVGVDQDGVGVGRQRIGGRGAGPAMYPSRLRRICRATGRLSRLRSRSIPQRSPPCLSHTNTVTTRQDCPGSPRLALAFSPGSSVSKVNQARETVPRPGKTVMKKPCPSVSG